MRSSVVVIGVGNPLRRDDGVGWAVADAARRQLPPEVAIVESDGEASRLLDAWTDHDLAVVVDAVCSGAEPGTIHVWDGNAEIAHGAPPAGTHALGLAAATALGRALERLPARLVIVGVEASETGPGHGLSPSVAGAIDGVIDVIERVVVASAVPASDPMTVIP
jgi:hydrogenase maturation protease